MRTAASRLLSPAFRLAEAVLPSSAVIRLQHLKAHGELPQLRPPVTFNEKLQWRKLYDRNPMMGALVDKIEVKAHVANTVGKQFVTPNYWTGIASELDELRSFTEPFVLKASHTSGDILLVRDPSSADFAELKRVATSWLRRRYARRSGEWAYRNVRPRLLAEELMLVGGAPPSDYKFFCFNGRVRFIQLDFGRFTDHRRLFLDSNWRDTGITYAHSRPSDSDTFKPPRNAQTLVEVAEAIAAPFDFCRVDLYDLDGTIRFGEITFYPEGGLGRFSLVSEHDEEVFRSWLGREAFHPTARELDTLVGEEWVFPVGV